ncbi:MAG: AraC family transcriptional regulator [Gammaproteobacteria bacterium]|nr:AraC family transcriptional regulator [Gammaproteobacteria bacterium]
MNFSSQLLFFFSALGAFNGLLLSAYLFFSNPSTTQRRLLSLLMLALSLRVSKSVWFYFDASIGKHFLQIGLSACFLIGPILYLYVVSNVHRLSDLRLKWTWHLAGVISLTVIVGILFPYKSNTELWGGFYQFINWTWGGYIVLAGLLMFPKVVVWLEGSNELNKDELLCANIYIGTTLIWLAYFTATYTSYIVGALSFSFILYISILIRLFSEKKNNSKQPYANKKIEDSVANELYQSLDKIMSEQKLYKQANITLPLLAKRLRVSTPVLSQFLNDNLKMSFSNYLNEWRIQEAKRLLVQSPNMTMDLVAEACGYNSQSTFYSAFKKMENITPAKYRNQKT